MGDIWSDTVISGFVSDKRYVVETSVKVVERCLLMATDPGDLVLDPFTGSGTTGVVAKQLGRDFVGCELNPEYAEMARKRIANPEPEPVIEDVPGQEVMEFNG